MSQAIVIDTNAYSAFKRGASEAIEIFQHADTIVLCPVVLAELFSGFALGNKEAQNKRELHSFLHNPKVLSISINQGTAEKYAHIFKHLKTQGTPIPTNDIWIAGFSLQLELALFSYDRHFERIPNLKLVKSLSDLV